MLRLGVWIIKDRKTGSFVDQELSEDIQKLIESDPQNGRTVLNLELDLMVKDVVKRYLEGE